MEALGCMSCIVDDARAAHPFKFQVSSVFCLSVVRVLCRMGETMKQRCRVYIVVAAVSSLLQTACCGVLWCFDLSCMHVFVLRVHEGGGRAGLRVVCVLCM